MKAHHKVVLWASIYLAAGVVHACVQNALDNPDSPSGRAFVGFTGNETSAQWWAEAILAWPVAMPYGLAGYPHEESGG